MRCSCNTGEVNSWTGEVFVYTDEVVGQSSEDIRLTGEVDS